MNSPSPLTQITTIQTKADAMVPQPAAGIEFEALLGELAQKSALSETGLPGNGQPLSGTAVVLEPSSTPNGLASPATLPAAVSVQQLPESGKYLPFALPVERREIPIEAMTLAPVGALAGPAVEAEPNVQGDAAPAAPNEPVFRARLGAVTAARSEAISTVPSEVVPAVAIQAMPLAPAKATRGVPTEAVDAAPVAPVDTAQFTPSGTVSVAPVEMEQVAPTEAVFVAPAETWQVAPVTTTTAAVVGVVAEAPVKAITAAPVETVTAGPVDAPIDPPEGPLPAKPKAKDRTARQVPEPAMSNAAEQAQFQAAALLSQPLAAVNLAETVTQPMPTAGPALLTEKSPPAEELSEGTTRHAPQAGLTTARPTPAPQATLTQLATAPAGLRQHHGSAPLPAQSTSPTDAIPTSYVNLAPQQDTAPVANVLPLRQFLVAAVRDERRGELPAALPDLVASPGYSPSESVAVPPASSFRPVELPFVSRPHDFAALVDRLVAARDAVQSNSVSIALPHAEFGQVALRFHRNETGLSVSMASPDPEFARAANLALLPVQQAAPGEPSTHNSGQPGNQSERHATPGDQSAQSRQHAPDRREERSTQRGQTGANHREPAARPRQQGIFA